MVNKSRTSAKKKDAASSAPMKKSDLTRQRILEVTSDLFRRNGYQATSMRDIATALGMKSGSLYYHYDSKEALLAAILNDNIDATLASLRQIFTSLPADATARQKFEAAIAASVKTISEAGDMAVASAQTLSFLQEPEYSEQSERRRAYNQFWRDIIIEGKEKGEIRKDLPDAVASMAIVGALTFVAEWYESDRSTTDEIGAIFARLFFDGMHA
ncbi:TetR/AcrR family transcriptional regulator [Sphingobium sp. OAS761]|uniref:TetR/AcrR family transcriptional regulator n=1 Tax=Sphingobium sp. OAS761 TaxID=2817901 RepID=UPI00209FA728|nr:TetR family transcriptional regulator [Sphingobium sp. OAS761]